MIQKSMDDFAEGKSAFFGSLFRIARDILLLFEELLLLGSSLLCLTFLPPIFSKKFFFVREIFSSVVFSFFLGHVDRNTIFRVFIFLGEFRISPNRYCRW